MLAPFGRMLGTPFNWLRGAASPDISPSSSESSYEPSVLDVLVVKAMMNRALGLPREVVDGIVDLAEYWPHTSTEVNYGGTKAVRGAIAGEENEFLLRTVPLGFPRSPYPAAHAPGTETDPPENQTQPQGLQANHPPAPEPRPLPDFQTPAPPKPVGQEYPIEVFQRLIDSPDDNLEHPCRKIVFTIKSCDQGWGGQAIHQGTYHGSCTWFEAGLERCSKPEACDQAPDGPVPVFASSALATVYPEVVRNPATNRDSFNYQLHARDTLKIQCNRTADGHLREHRVVWSYTDNTKFDADSEPSPEVVALDDAGRGKATADGTFVRSLKLGDVVTLWAFARFPGWLNLIDRVKVDIYWAV
ncbi:hypothetical protein B0T22DRAFT_65038 [Podospora appendiculata]|uniref:Uncharacterized protein n=1 Tax=Podospora appendiculata TaxID=314037 RepID=A0AAE0XIV2_9PEZI|nr:hypothetical protein B0T22DRAFT_65038 [Podospora appendiculata]